MAGKASKIGQFGLIFQVLKGHFGWPLLAITGKGGLINPGLNNLIH
jgi:hypothetical protein